MTKTELRRLENNVEIIGTLKSKELELKISQNRKRYISGRLVVQSIVNNKINEYVIEVFTMESSKLFKCVESVKDNYFTIDDDGAENADKIKVMGFLKLKEYVNKQGNLIQYNEIRGSIFSGLYRHDKTPDKAVATIETVIEGFTEKLDENNLPTGDYKVQGFTVGWNDEVVEFKDTFVGADLAQSFMNLYQPDMTGQLSFRLLSYPDLEEKNEFQQVQQGGFGIQVSIETPFKPKTRYISSLEVVGGKLPYSCEKAYSQKEINNAKEVRKNKLLELQSKSEFREGFPNQNVPAQLNSTGSLNMNDMPDF